MNKYGISDWRKVFKNKKFEGHGDSHNKLYIFLSKLEKNNVEIINLNLKKYTFTIKVPDDCKSVFFLFLKYNNQPYYYKSSNKIKNTITFEW